MAQAWNSLCLLAKSDLRRMPYLPNWDSEMAPVCTQKIAIKGMQDASSCSLYMKGHTQYQAFWWLAVDLQLSGLHSLHVRGSRLFNRRASEKYTLGHLLAHVLVHCNMLACCGRLSTGEHWCPRCSHCARRQPLQRLCSWPSVHRRALVPQVLPLPGQTASCKGAVAAACEHSSPRASFLSTGWSHNVEVPQPALGAL